MTQNKRFSFFLLLLLFALPLYAQTERETFRILGIRVEGSVSADPATIIATSGLKVGDEISIPGDQTSSAIKQLWSLNIFSDVQVISEKEINNGVYLLIRVTEFPRIETAVVTGNDEIDAEDIEAKMNFYRGQVLKPVVVQKLKNDIKKLCDDEGYFNASVEMRYYRFFRADTTQKSIVTYWQNEKDLSDEYMYEYSRTDEFEQNVIEKIKSRILLIVKVDERERVTVRDITFVGNNAFSDDDLYSELEELSSAVWWRFWSSDRYDKAKFLKDKATLENFYQKNGFRDAEVIGDSIVYFNDNKDMHLYITVHEGTKYFIRNITFTGNSVYPAEVLLDRLGIRKGDVYDYPTFNQNLRGNEKQTDVASLYLDNGYLTFNLKTVETKAAGDSIDIAVLVTENNQFKIGFVDIAGNDKTKDKVIRRELYTVPGDFFNRAAMLRSVQQLANLGFFNVEKLYSNDGLDYSLVNDSTVNVVFKVEEKSSDYLNASVGYSGSFGFSGAVGVTLTNFSIAEPFTQGAGQILSFNWQFGVGSLYQTFTLGFTEPWLLNTPTLVGVEVFNTRQQYIYDMTQYGGTLKVGRRLRWPDDYFYLQSTFRYQHNDVLDGGGNYAEGKSDQFTLGAVITRKNIDNPIFPSAGSTVTLDAEISGGPFLPGSVDYYKLLFTAEWYRRLFNTNRFTLFLSTQLGYLEELEANTPINPFEYFYMGGSGLVIATVPLRGYDDRTVGPYDQTDRIIGGRVMMKHTLELRYAVALDPIPLYVLLFAEAGRVFSDIKTTDALNLRRSVGFGARILINPIGLIGFDLGWGFDRKIVDGKDPSWQFHFKFGQSF